MSKEGGFGRIWPFRSAERKNTPEAYTPEHISKIVLESFFMSQGSARSQRGILSRFMRQHPEAHAGIRALRAELVPDAPAKEELPASVWESILYVRDGETLDTQIMGWEDKHFPIDTDALLRNPVIAKLIDDGVKFILAPWHPKPTELYRKLGDGTYELLPPEEMKAKARELSIMEMKARFQNLFLVEMAVASGGERTMSEGEAMQKLVDDMLEQDLRRAERFAKDTGSDEFKMRIQRGVSFIAKYALSKGRRAAQERFPEELKEVWEAVGTFLRKNRKGLSDEARGRLTKLLALYETHDPSHERISI